MTKVKMINSVADHVAGVEIDLPDDVADVFIIRGYAEGELSRDFSDEERGEILIDHQTVEF